VSISITTVAAMSWDFSTEPEFEEQLEFAELLDQGTVDL
jgi:hypothetical protein